MLQLAAAVVVVAAAESLARRGVDVRDPSALQVTSSLLDFLGTAIVLSSVVVGVVGTPVFALDSEELLMESDDEQRQMPVV